VGHETLAPERGRRSTRGSERFTRTAGYEGRGPFRACDVVSTIASLVWPEPVSISSAFREEQTTRSCPKHELRASAHHIMSKDTDDLRPEDYHLAVRRREHSEKPWRWEIWAAGRTKVTAQSEHFYPTMSEATRDGKAALRMLRERFSKSVALLVKIGE
jgi:hypothetical protein